MRMRTRHGERDEHNPTCGADFFAHGPVVFLPPPLRHGDHQLREPDIRLQPDHALGTGLVCSTHAVSPEPGDTASRLFEVSKPCGLNMLPSTCGSPPPHSTQNSESHWALRSSAFHGILPMFYDSIVDDAGHSSLDCPSRRTLSSSFSLSQLDRAESCSIGFRIAPRPAYSGCILTDATGQVSRRSNQHNRVPRTPFS
jgi:hypothetical protein